MPQMTVYYIGVLRATPKPAAELAAVKHLARFGTFQQGSVSTFLTFFAGVCAERVQPGEQASIDEESYTFHVYYHSTGVAGIVVTNQEYPKLVAHKLLSQIIQDDFIPTYPAPRWATQTPPPSFEKDTFTTKTLQGYIEKYQDPEKADSILRIQKEVDETKIVLHKTIESLLERGEKLDNLVERSNQLSGASKMFYKQAKKQNSCCTIM